MKKGDIVRIKSTMESLDYFGEYVNSDAQIIDLFETHCNIELFDGKITTAPIAFIEPIYNQYINNKCECGAWATKFSNFHAHYCPQYKDHS